MRVKHGSVELLERAGIPSQHAVKLQGQNVSLTGFSTRLMTECEFSYGRVFGSHFMPYDTFSYLIPHEALEAKGFDTL
jgi:hypothetical protein